MKLSRAAQWTKKNKETDVQSRYTPIHTDATAFREGIFAVICHLTCESFSCRSVSNNPLILFRKIKGSPKEMKHFYWHRVSTANLPFLYSRVRPLAAKSLTFKEPPSAPVGRRESVVHRITVCLQKHMNNAHNRLKTLASRAARRRWSSSASH